MSRNFRRDDPGYGGTGTLRSGSAYREDETDPYHLTLESLIASHPIIFEEEPSLSYVSIETKKSF
jgi:hypothetical protein